MLNILNAYMDLYYNGIIDKDITIFFLKQPEYIQKYKEISKEIGLRPDKDFDKTVGYFFHDAPKNKYYVLILDCDKNESHYVMTLFHELSHIETYPSKLFHQIQRKKQKKYASKGLQFWAEYIAQNEADNQYQMKIRVMNIMNDKELQKKYAESLIATYFDGILYDLVSMCEMTGYKVEKIQKEMDDLILELKKIKSQFTCREDIKKISITQINTIGYLVNELESRMIAEKMI